MADSATGRFDFPKVIPGPYVAYLFMNNMTIRENIDVRNGDVDGVSLTISEGITIPVNITLEGEPPARMPSLDSLNVVFFRNPTLLQAPSMPQGRGGAERAVQNIAPGDYHVYVNPILQPVGGSNPIFSPQQWQGVYVKSMKLDGAEALAGGVRIERAPQGKLEIVLGTNPGTLQGQVLNDRKEPVVGAFVTLLAAAPADRIYRSDQYKVTSTDTAGRFSVNLLPPGDYKVFAWENLERATWMDSTFLRQYEDRGVPVRIAEGMVHTADIPVVSFR
jgi:hypothetical protein